MAATFQKLKKPYSKYEMSTTGIVRNVKTKAIRSKEKNGTSIRLINEVTKKETTVKVEDLKIGSPEPVSKPSLKDKKTSLGQPSLTTQPKIKKEKVAGEKTERTPRSQSTMFQVNLLHHQGKTNEEIIAALGITQKKYLDCRWHYDNKGYKEKIEKHLATQE